MACGLSCVLGGCRLETPRKADAAVASEIEALETRPWGEPDVVLAQVNGKAITRGEFYKRVLKRFGSWELLNGLIKDELFQQEADRLRIDVGEDEVARRVDALLEEMDPRLEREGLDREAVRLDLTRDVSTQLLYGKVVMAMREVSEADIETHYKQTYRHKRYLVRHIAYGFRPRPGQSEEDGNTVKLEAWNKAQKAADRVRKGGDFASLARTESEDAVTAERGGLLPPIHGESPMDPALKEAIFKLKAGEVSDPVENVNGGYHVFQVTDVLPSESFADCKEKIRAELLGREPTVEEVAAALETLRKRAEISVFGTPQTVTRASGTIGAGGGSE